MDFYSANSGKGFITGKRYSNSYREFNFEVQFPIKNQAAFRSSSKTTCGCLNPKHLRGLKFSRFS
ncbi:hypothetical protein ACEUB5_18030, partial [Aeromonas veronii]